ncbi:MAG: protease complex subunit PrcB family protein [Promethearchaeota archaeon]
MRLRVFVGLWVALILSAGLFGVLTKPTSLTGQTLETDVYYDYYCDPFEQGIHIVATDRNPLEIREDYSFMNAYNEMLREHVTTKAGTEDFISIVISRGRFSTGGFGIGIELIESVGNRFILNANFTDPGKGIGVTLALSNPIAMILLGNLSRGHYSITLHIDKYRHDAVNGGVYRYLGRETWKAIFEIL